MVTVGVVGVVVRMRVVVDDARVPRRLPRRGLCVAAGDEVSVLELGTTRLLRRQLELDKHHVITDTQRQGEWGAARQEVVDLQTKKRDFESSHSENLPEHVCCWTGLSLKDGETHRTAFSGPPPKHRHTTLAHHAINHTSVTLAGLQLWGSG